MLAKNISFQDFQEALTIVVEYCKQYEIIDTDALEPSEKTINIQEGITYQTYKILVKYYKHEYNMDLHKSDLETMNRDLLAAIDYNKMANLRGLGPVGIAKLKRTMQFYGIIE